MLLKRSMSLPSAEQSFGRLLSKDLRLLGSTV